MSRTHPLGTVGRLGDEAIAGLADDLRGDLILPDDERYDDARDVWNGLINRYPAIVARVAGARDVARAVGFVREHDLPLSVRGGAHHQAGDAVVDNGLVVDLADLDHVGVDTAAGVATVGPGNTTAEVLAETQAHGLAPPTGSAGCAGVAGTTLGGGIGWLRRAHGLAIDSLRRVEVVTPDGELRTASPDREPELFWALRGGGGDVGIVTGFEFDLHEVGPIVAGLSTFYPGAAAEEVLAAYREATAAAPRQLTTICNHGEIPAIPGMPPELHGEPAIGVIGCHVGDPEAGMDAIAPFRELAGVEPLVDNSDPLPYEALHEVGTLLHPWGRKYVHRSAFVDDLSPEVRSLIVERTEAAPGPMDGVGVWHMGGAVRDGPDAAFPWREPSYMLVVEAAWEGHDAPAHMSWARETDRLLREAGAEGRYANYAGVEEGDDEDWRAEAYGDARERLAAAKRRYDPDDLLGGSLGVDPADANPDADASAAD